jgi:hypothetical protein
VSWVKGTRLLEAVLSINILEKPGVSGVSEARTNLSCAERWPLIIISHTIFYHLINLDRSYYTANLNPNSLHLFTSILTIPQILSLIGPFEQLPLIIFSHKFFNSHLLPPPPFHPSYPHDDDNVCLISYNIGVVSSSSTTPSSFFLPLHPLHLFLGLGLGLGLGFQPLHLFPCFPFVLLSFSSFILVLFLFTNTNL